MSSAADLLPCPFVAGPKITDLRLFVGRKERMGFQTSEVLETSEVYGQGLRRRLRDAALTKALFWAIMCAESQVKFDYLRT
ncbi:MAG: hypothetical protein ABWK53_09710 [Anaerolineales bacterium]